jgi:hypothetical protein
LRAERSGKAPSAEDEEFTMSTQDIVQQWERELLEKGRAEGARGMVARQLRGRLGPLDAATENRIAMADVDELNRWSDRIIGAERVDDVFKE